MPGVVPLEDAQNYYVDRLKQHAQDGWQALTSTAQQAPQQLAAVAPAPPQIDPNEIIQRLQQHAQQAWQDAQTQAQQAVQGAQQAVQPVQQPLPTIDASDVTNRLQQHAQDTWKSLDAGVQQIGQGVQSFNQPPPQAVATPATQDASTNAQATSAVIQPNQPTQPGQANQQQPADSSGGPNTPIDASSPTAFAKSMAPYAQYAAQKLGIDPTWVAAMAASESNYGKADAAGHELFGVKALPGQAGTTLMTHEGENGGVNMNQSFAAYDSAKSAVDAWVDLLQKHYPGAVNAKDLPTFIHGLRAGGYFTAGEQEYLNIVKGIQSRIGGDVQNALSSAGDAVGNAASTVGTGAQNAVQGAQQAISNKLPDVSQFGDKQLTAAEAYAACGPAAAVRFAQMFGRNPSLREATDLASKVGWTAGSGMAGLQSESKLFDEMGIPHRTVGADWTALAKEASSGNPVTISTPGHYFTADSYDASTGAFHVGRSGLDLRVGKEWMTPAEMEAAMGKLQGGLAADNPQTPAPSPLAQPATTSRQSYTTPRTVMGGLQDAAGNLAADASHAIGQGMQGVGQAVGGTLQTVDNAVQSAASQATAPATLKPGEEPATSTLSAAATNAAPAVQAGTQAAQDTLRKVPGPFGVSTVGDIADTAGNIASKVQTPDENAPGGVVGRAVGTGLSALGSAAQEANAALDKINIASNLARDATGSDQYNNLYAQAGGPALEDEYRTLLQRRMNGDDSVSPRMTEIVNQLQSINDGIRGGTSRQDQGELNQRLSEQNPLTGSAVGLANVGAAGLATVLAAGDAPLALRAVAEVLQPGTNPLEIARALTAVDGARGTAPEVANAVDQAWQQFGGRLTDTAAERAQQIAKMDVSGRNQLVQAISNAVPSTRMFHGTGSDFARVDPTKVAGEDNLFGPGYYLTSHPDVAGGVVSRGGEQVGPSWLVSAVKRGGGEVTSPGYAQSRADDFTALQADLSDVKTQLAQADLSDRRRFMLQQRQQDLQQQIVDYNPRSGPNVRALDVPQDLRLFNTDRGVSEPEITNLADAAARAGHTDAEDFLRQIAARSGGISGEDLYNDLQRGGYGLSKTEINNLLADAGYDGITYAGGNRIPMNDASGMPIQHQATVVFPGALDKVRNAVSGTQGGQVAAPFAARLGGAAAGGAAGYQTTPEDASPQERALRTGAGAVAGYAGVAAASKVVSALRDLMKPGLAAPQLEQAIKTVNETTASAPEILDQVRKMPGTAELAPVRQRVPQSSTDLLQAMLDAARAKGVDPDKLAALEQQITDMDPTAATRRALTPPPAAGTPGAAEVPGVGGAVGDFLRGESGAIPLTRATLRGSTTLGGAVAGGLAGNASTPDDALTLPTPLGDIPIERGVRIATGAGIGAGLGSAAGFRGPLEQSVLRTLRQGGLVSGPARGAPLRGPIAEAVDATKQSILTNPATHIANVIGNTIELGRQPIALAMGGRGDDALAGLTSVVRGVPQAAGNALEALKGNQLATLAGGASVIPKRAPVFRALSAADAFTRTLAEYQGMASEANRLLRTAGMSPGDPGAAAFLAGHAPDLYRQGARAGAQSVFGRVASSGTGTGVLDSMFRTYSNAKEGLLNSPKLGDQAMGALMDFFIPFSGVPVQMLQIGLNRLPVTAQATGTVRALRALKAGNVAEAQRAVGETGLETAVQLMIAKNVADGNITGPDDPEHPNSVKMNGNWVSMNEWGAYALPMQIMASFADGFQKGGQDVPAGSSTAEYYGPRFAAALNSSLKPFQQGIPGENLIRLVSNIGQGGTTAGALGLAQDAVNRITVPGAARFAENLTDPVTREINRKGVSSLWEGTMANWPGLAGQLPAKIDPTTGEVLQKARTGAGILVGVQQDIASPITREADRLNKAGYSITAPKAYSDTVSYQGAQVKLSPVEQRAVAQATGHVLGDFARRLDESDYQQSSEDRKAKLMQAYLNAADQAKLKAWIDLVGPDTARQRLTAAQRTVGRLNVQAPPPAFTAPFLSSSSQSAQDQQAVGAGR